MLNRKVSYRGGQFKAHILAGLLLFIYPAGKSLFFADNYSEGKSNGEEGQLEDGANQGDTFIFPRIIVTAEPPCDLKAVNTITPNGDGINDTLKFEGISAFPQRQLKVFNRWGEIVHKNLNYKNSWEGTYKNEPLPAGTYLYVLRLKSGDQICNIRGTVTIIR